MRARRHIPTIFYASVSSIHSCLFMRWYATICAWVFFRAILSDHMLFYINFLFNAVISFHILYMNKYKHIAFYYVNNLFGIWARTLFQWINNYIIIFLYVANCFLVFCFRISIWDYLIKHEINIFFSIFYLNELLGC